LCAIIAAVTQIFQRYCQNSWSPGFSHLWITIILAISAFVAQRALQQVKHQFQDELPQVKLGQIDLCIQSVILLSFFQTLIITALTLGEDPILKTGPQISDTDLAVGIPGALLCVEMLVLSVVHMFVFSHSPFRVHTQENSEEQQTTPYYGGPLGVLAILDVINPWDTIKASSTLLNGSHTTKRSEVMTTRG